MSVSNLRRRNRGAYGSPFSGVGVDFDPLVVLPDRSGLTLHESGYLPRNDWWNFPNVLSPFWRLYYNFKPGHRILFHHRTVELTPRHLVLIPDHLLFHCQGNTPVSTFWLAFSPPRRLDPAQKVPILLRPSRTEMQLIRDLTCLIAPAPRDRQRIRHFSIALLHLVLCRPEIRWQQAASPVLRSLVAFIEENYPAPIRVADLAHKAGMCPESLARRFTRWMGCAPARFISQVRVRHAADLLANTDQTIDAIAQQTGFPNRAYFSRVFRKITADSPAHFRRQHAPGAQV